jgi:hopanoid biosynthesis associated protein HpnK
MRELIVNADDFGLTRQVSQGILDAHRDGIVTSTTLLANGRAFEDAVSMSHQAPQLGIGVHLNLSEGAPVLPPFKIPSLVNAVGTLHLTPDRLGTGILKRRVSLSDVERELHAQIEKVIREGISPTHLDGHKHVHVLPGISAIVIRLAQQFGIRNLRCPDEERPNLARLLRSEGARAPVIKQYVVGRAVSRFAYRFKVKLETAGLICPARFYGLSETGFLDLQGVQEILSRLPRGISELMCHPGYVDAELRGTGTRLLAQREVEIQALTSPRISKLVADQGIRLVSYRDLARSRQLAEAAA